MESHAVLDVSAGPEGGPPESSNAPLKQLDNIVVGRPTRFRSTLVDLLRTEGYRVDAYDTVKAAISAVRGAIPGLILVGTDDAGHPNVCDSVRLLRRHFPLVDVVPYAREAESKEVIAAIRWGARDFLVDLDPATFLERIEHLTSQQQYIPRLQQLREHLTEHNRFEGLFSRSRKMWDVFEVVEHVADTDATVLIEGETGTGKELLARAVYQRSGRRRGAFLAVDCGAMAETLLDSELFGHEKGAFTGANATKIGLFEQAQKGTLFLDEIGNISENMQQRLLRVLEAGYFRRVGSTRERETDVRIIAATNRNLQEAVAVGEFREDLFYRLNVIRIVIPPLRERPEDVLFLLNHYLERYSRQYGMKRPKTTDAVIDVLLSHSWPGNVRELQNTAERLVLVARGGGVQLRHLPHTMRPAPTPSPRGLSTSVDISRPLREVVGPVVAQVEKEYLVRILEKHGGKLQICARQADISRRTLYRKMKEFDLDKRSFRRGESSGSASPLPTAPAGSDDHV